MWIRARCCMPSPLLADDEVCLARKLAKAWEKAYRESLRADRLRPCPPHVPAGVKACVPAAMCRSIVTGLLIWMPVQTCMQNCRCMRHSRLRNLTEVDCQGQVRKAVATEHCEGKPGRVKSLRDGRQGLWQQSLKPTRKVFGTSMSVVYMYQKHQELDCGSIQVNSECLQHRVGQTW
jgi:hypothetical protein